MGEGAVFTSRDFDEVLASTRVDGSWLIVDATAEWCGPCKEMEAITWPDPRVVAWVTGHGIAVQVDVDRQRPLAQSLHIDAMPTIIAFKGGQEADRVVGLRQPDELLEWLSGLESGESNVDRLRRSIDPENDILGRRTLARELLGARRFEEATEEYLSLWEHSDRGSGGPQRLSVGREIQRLVRHHPPARERFEELRGVAEAAANRSPESAQERLEWMELNEALGDDERSLAWFNLAKDDESADEVIERCASRLERLLIGRKRWADVSRLWKDPQATLAQSFESRQVMKANRDKIPASDVRFEELLQQVGDRSIRKRAGALYASLLAAGRTEEAQAIEREALRRDPSEEMRTALRDMATEALG